MDLLLGLVLACGAGCLVAIPLVWSGVAVLPHARPRRRTRADAQLVRCLLGGVGAGVLVAIATRWVLIAVVVAVLVGLAPWLLGAGSAARRQMERLEALATWTESLRDTTQAAAGLEQAIPATVDTAPVQIREPLHRLSARLQARVPTPDALHQLADDLDDPLADMVVAALALNATLRGGRLSRVLGELAAAARAELEMRRRIDKPRAALRWQLTGVLVVITAFVTLQKMFMSEYVEPYSTAEGQLVLGLMGAAFVLLLAWMRRLADPPREMRFLASADDVRLAAEYRGGRSW